MPYNPESIHMFDVGDLVVSHDDESDLSAVNFNTERLYSIRNAFGGSVIHFLLSRGELFWVYNDFVKLNIIQYRRISSQWLGK